MNSDQHGKGLEIKLPIEIEQYERKIYDLKQLIEISKGLNSTLDYNILIDSILLTCMGQMQLLKAGIFTKKEISHDLFVLHRNYKGFEIDHSLEYGIPVDSALVRFLESGGRCYEMSEILKMMGDDPSLETFKIIDPCLIFPLKGKGRLNGIIILGERINTSKFLESEKEFLLNIASLAGIAIQNAYLFELATTDMMTGLKIHHFFQNSLMEERERALANKTPLSLIMMDIDHFKNFNDSYGHLCGDQVLINVARLTMDNIRQLDLAARYGGEEFIILLPNTEITEARAVAERIRKSIEGARVECGQNALGVTVSLGVAQFDPERDMSNLNLIERADKAMYLSKEGGRNRISVLT
ncbi:MAG TPA: diguanylate cyclase DgcA [Spirochaetota bacterium]|nr:diguanylate cyclase DgcA [Spirochaetota bacterium]